MPELEGSERGMKMAEFVAEAKVFVVHMKCEKCGEGIMVPFGDVALMTYPPQYPHKCINCGNVENYAAIYPKHRFVLKEPLRAPMEGELDND